MQNYMMWNCSLRSEYSYSITYCKIRSWRWKTPSSTPTHHERCMGKRKYNRSKLQHKIPIATTKSFMTYVIVWSKLKMREFSLRKKYIKNNYEMRCYDSKSLICSIISRKTPTNENLRSVNSASQLLQNACDYKMKLNLKICFIIWNNSSTNLSIRN